MDREELGAWLRLLGTPGVGTETARRLLAAFGLPQAVFDAGTAALRQVASAAQVAALQSVPDELPAQIDTLCAWLEGRGDAAGDVPRRFVTLGDAAYPQALLAMEDPPIALYLLGRGFFYASNRPPAQELPKDVAIENIANAWASTPAIAMVGSRNPTPQGVQNARAFAKHFADAGLTVVSGLALGIDAAAHEGALEGSRHDPAHCPCTIAVVGTGLDRVYPRAHRALAHRIAEDGLIVSEYPLGTPPLAANFPRRNRLIAGLSLGTLVVEAAQPSGSLITARLAVEQGKEVFAIPGSIHSAQSRGCHALIRQGAKLVESAHDVLEELRLPSGAGPGGAHAAGVGGVTGPGGSDAFEGETSPVLEAMGYDPVALDALVARTGIDASVLQVRLLELELDMHVARLPGGLFQRTAAG